MSRYTEGTFALLEIQTGGIAPQKMLCPPHKAVVPDGFQLVHRVGDSWVPWARPERLQLMDEIDESLAELQGKVDELRAVLSD